MRRRIMLLLVILTIGGSNLSAAAETAPMDIPWPPWWGDLPPVESGTGPAESTAPRVAVSRPSPALLEMLSAWLVANFALPETRELPRVELVPRMRLATLRYRGLVSDRAPAGKRSGPLSDLDAVQAVYDQDKRTIYLPEDWGGETPADVSVLVHELVHHLQNAAGLRYSCPQEAERPAYDAQARWLAMFGKTFDELGLDDFYVWVRTRCID